MNPRPARKEGRTKVREKERKELRERRAVNFLTMAIAHYKASKKAKHRFKFLRTTEALEL